MLAIEIWRWSFCGGRSGAFYDCWGGEWHLWGFLSCWFFRKGRWRDFLSWSEWYCLGDEVVTFFNVLVVYFSDVEDLAFAAAVSVDCYSFAF